MELKSAAQTEPCHVRPELVALISTISPDWLRKWVEGISLPRHYSANAAANQAAARWVATQLDGWGYHVDLQGEYLNVVARPKGVTRPVLLVAAHYDSVPNMPGADDNGSAVAALLACAWTCRNWRPDLPVAFVAFNREEDGLLGSEDYVTALSSEERASIQCVHVLEMVGYADHKYNTQKVPPGLPVQLPSQGNFLGLVANFQSTSQMMDVLGTARAYLPKFPVIGLPVPPGTEPLFPVLHRSDHASFWEAGVPAIMWTDTAEFRNPHYHQHTDLPSTLNYTFLLQVTQVLVATVVTEVMKLEGK
jgi:Zn-dependent M28 family amino/carboxypeptidase